jgi:hypothetical protein
VRTTAALARVAQPITVISVISAHALFAGRECVG